MNARRRFLVLALVALAGAALVVHSLLWNFVTDDAFISFVYARNLARHGQLVFNLGERVEGYTNFLWAVLLAGFLKIGLPAEIMSRLLGTASAVATLFVCADASKSVRHLMQSHQMEDSAWDALPALFLCAVPGYACWSSGGLETQLFTLLVTLGAALYLREQREGRVGRGSAIAFGLSALTRPEGLLFFGLTALHRGLSNLQRERRLLPTAAEWRWVGWFALFPVPHFLWRRWYYGWWLPNTFYIKSSGIGGTWAHGGYYLMRLVLQFHLWVVPLLVIAALLVRRDRGLLWLTGFASLWVGAFFLYIASVGGDFMGLFRFAMPALPMLALLAATSLRVSTEPLASRWRWAPAAIVLALLAGHAVHAGEIDRRSLAIDSDNGIDSPGYLRWYTADRAAIGKWFGRYARPDDFADVGGAGAQVYYSGIRSLDCFGLSDAYIAHHVPAHSSRPGHEKYAPIEYELSHHPTIITSAYYRLGRYTPAPYEASMWRARGYHYVTVEVPGLSSRFYSFLLRNDRRFGPLPALVGPEAAGQAREP